ncbi:hypothetical protein VN12_11880 [Pirellula sp. SH-Sr6A]|uniref:hypothetical protein n=1 Tax=Pirellula sp. SH-Sr6A TaxID=1632865 RepID=UPI00078DE3F4|nr:hypothetical protein [Pirellula sp. SH-Sr6A]AMV32816.1 hypothetical protein VN12_11880 [Pirellula sp. SH-Sr6A]
MSNSSDMDGDSSAFQSTSNDSRNSVLGDIGMCAAAGGMGWGIRGQYGHETGAMIAGVLVGLAILLRFTPNARSLSGARAAAMFAVAIGVGGSMTYGQTTGLTHDPKLVGNWGALLWGMLGLGIKGGLWIGIAATFLGAGLSGVHYRWWEWVFVLALLYGAQWIGVVVINCPFDPENHRLPWIYFSSDWRWSPDHEWKPRPEVWGGILFCYSTLLFYLGWFRVDRLALKLGLWGALGGAVGFPAGQSLQAFYGWNREWFHTLAWTAKINWWNMMEIAFGAIMAATLAIGLYLHRNEIRPRANPVDEAMGRGAWEYSLLSLHAILLALAEFTSGMPILSHLYDDGLSLLFLPIVLICRGFAAPYFILLPIVLIPIAGKTIRQLGYLEPQVPLILAWIIYGALPICLMTAIAWYSSRNAERERASKFASRALLTATWVYFGLNFGFFRYPLPWEEWTARTPSNLIFMFCALVLTAGCLRDVFKDGKTKCSETELSQGESIQSSRD